MSGARFFKLFSINVDEKIGERLSFLFTLISQFDTQGAFCAKFTPEVR